MHDGIPRAADRPAGRSVGRAGGRAGGLAGGVVAVPISMLPLTSEPSSGSDCIQLAVSNNARRTSLIVGGAQFRLEEVREAHGK